MARNATPTSSAPMEQAISSCISSSSTREMPIACWECLETLASSVTIKPKRLDIRVSFWTNHDDEGRRDAYCIPSFPPLVSALDIPLIVRDEIGVYGPIIVEAGVADLFGIV
ncbi:hypothetical protein PM082_020961 [Marasmius tenuissimus]|nr:hypothetical protein PM082_020961 [Marasmius tenuissimus]